MAVTAIAGVVAAGRVPTWIIPAALITTDPVVGTWSIPLLKLNDATVAKADCHMDAGDMSVTRTSATKSRQRMCQVIAETIATSETIDITLSAVFDQQAAPSAAVNKVYAALPEGSVVYIAQAFGWDSALTPTVATKLDLLKATVQTRMKTQPTTIDEDLKFLATLSGSAYFADIALT